MARLALSPSTSRRKFDLVIDLHDSATEGDTAAYVCDNTLTGFRNTNRATMLASMLDFKNIVHFIDRDVNITSQIPDSFSAEVSPDSELNDVAIWRERLTDLTDHDPGFAVPDHIPSFELLGKKLTERLSLSPDSRALSWDASQQYGSRAPRFIGEIIEPRRSPPSSHLGNGYF